MSPSPTIILSLLFFATLLFTAAGAAAALPIVRRRLNSLPPCSSRSFGYHNSSTFHCPPFKSPPPFPFSTSPGCGHPSFQIHCASPFSLITASSSASFLLLDVDPASFVLVSPILTNISDNSPCPSLPSATFHLPPFRPSNDVCRSLAALRPCRQPDPSAASSTSCRLSSWQRRLLSEPLLLLPSCSPSYYASRSPTSCRLSTSDENHDDASAAAELAAFLSRGIRLEWNSSSDRYFTNCTLCRSGGGVCGFNNSATGNPFLCFSLPSGESDGGSSRRLLFLTTALFASACVLFVALSLCAATSLRRGGICLGFFSGRGGGDNPPSDPSITAFFLRHRLHQPVYSYDQLLAATGGFDPARKIGDGGFGSVYLAHLSDRRVVAVKRLHRHHPAAAATKSFCNEILILSSLRHPNLVRLHGYCSDPRGLLLVYDYVPNGTFADHLHGCSSYGSARKAPLSGSVRIDVALQTAAALEYLHFAVKPPVVHRDITSSNIFLDGDMRVKLGDFGLSRLLVLPDSSSSSTEYIRCTGPQGTPGYLDPEYHRSFQLTEKSDIYSFGVVLLELVTGMKAVDTKRDRSEVALVDMAMSKIHTGALHQVMDPAILKEGNEVTTAVEAMAELAFRCVAGDKDDRPDARELVQELKRISTSITDVPKKS